MQDRTMNPTQQAESFRHTVAMEASPRRVWEALTDGAQTPGYYINGAELTGEMRAGGRYAYMDGDREMVAGDILAVEPERLLDMTFEPIWAPAAISRNRFEIEPDGEGCRLTIVHYDLPSDQNGVKQGWRRIAASLKKMLAQDVQTPA